MRGLAILLAFNFLGLLICKLARVPMPGNVVGLVLFTACLFGGVVKLEWVEESASFLLRHMLLFFAPYVVGTLAFTKLLQDEWLPVAVGIGGSFLAVLLVTGWATTLLAGTAGLTMTSGEKAGEA
jgi:holin-like protein